MNNSASSVVAIIGAGPRGLSALESLYASLAEGDIMQKVNILIFETTDQWGNGPVYDMEQPDTNWLNVSDRGLTIPAREPIFCERYSIKGFPSYHSWCGFEADKNVGTLPDNFTIRSLVGRYLNERFMSIATPLMRWEFLKVVPQKVEHLEYENSRFLLKTSHGKYCSEEVVLTIGHQPTQLDEQMTLWKEKAEKNLKTKLVKNPYPVAAIRNTTQNNDVVAIRGFGLAMVDIARALTIGLGGSFLLRDNNTRKMTYQAAEKHNVKLVPFSLNGLPMTPKPLSFDLDKVYIPTGKELKSFGKRIENAIEGDEKVSDTSFLITAIAPLIVQKYLTLDGKVKTHALSANALENVVVHWLKDSSFEHDLILSKSLPTYDSMQAFVNMATGNTNISLDYCIGQVWRHCQPTMYSALAFADLEDEVIAEIIELDERLKRYSYGPPVDSLTQILAMIDAGVMTLDFVNDPEISFNKKGWIFSKDEKSIVATMMIDSVLDSPKLLEINSPLVKSLLSNAMVAPVHSALGINTNENALVELRSGKEAIPLAVLGRLAKGTVIGVDAILECFGERSELWAEGVVQRVKKIKA